MSIAITSGERVTTSDTYDAIVIGSGEGGKARKIPAAVG
jgi:hypothetical protein